MIKKYPWKLQLVPIGIVVVAFEVLIQSGILVQTAFPAPSQVAVSVGQLLLSVAFWFDVYVSVYEIVLGMGIGLTLGVIGGALAGSYGYIYALIEPLMYYFNAVPKIILLPLFILFFGVGIESKIAIGAASAFFPIIINTSLAFNEVKPIYVRVGKSFRASRYRLYSSIYAPAIFGPVLSGIRLGLGVAVTGVLLAETAVAQAGLGFRALEFYSHLRIADMYALLLIIFVGAATVSALFGYFITRSTRYSKQSASGAVAVR